MSVAGKHVPDPPMKTLAARIIVLISLLWLLRAAASTLSILGYLPRSTVVDVTTFCNVGLCLLIAYHVYICFPLLRARYLLVLMALGCMLVVTRGVLRSLSEANGTLGPVSLQLTRLMEGAIANGGALILVGAFCYILVSLRNTVVRLTREEERLRESEEKYRSLVETSSDWIWEVDERGRYTYVSPRVIDILGYDPKVLLNHTPFEFMPEDEAIGVESAFEQIVSAQRPFFGLENTCRHKDGQMVVLESSGVPVRDQEGRWIGYRGMDRDVTERKNAENALRETEEQHRTIIQTAMDGFWLADMKGRLLLVNDAYCRMSGYTQDELLTMKIFDLEAEESGTETRARLERLMTEGEDRFELRHRHKDGHEYDVEISAKYRTLAGGQIVVFLREITERKRAEAERAQLEEKLRQSQKLEAIGQLAGGVAHDFNNLLQVMLGYVQLIASELGKEHPQRKDLLEIAKAGNRAKNLVSQLLTFSRRQILRPEHLDVNEVIASFLKMLTRVIGEHIRLEFTPGHSAGAIHADRGMMEQVLMNLCVNARDAMGPGGCLTIETEHAVLDEEFCATSPGISPGNYVLLTVGDTGCGMDGDTLDRIFEPFFSTKGVDKGTGLGLATVYGIVCQHSGAIRVESEPGKGTVFYIYLPTVEQCVESPATSVETPMYGGTETILLVEDDDGVRKLATRILSEAGYTVVAACNGAEAIAKFRETPDSIDLLLLDVVMPVMSGGEACRRIRELSPAIPALFASGYAENAIHSDFVLPAGMQLIQKPYKPNDLLKKIRDALSPAAHA
ncbi:MAG: PAS domain S-box protein [Candidatus Hydrogenedentales bacterium]|jgi:PAS domain S-box-containing protein